MSSPDKQVTDDLECSPYLGRPLRSEEEARRGVMPGKLGCDYCAGESDPGWLETDNNGPIVPCPFCNKDTRNDAR